MTTAVHLDELEHAAEDVAAHLPDAKHHFAPTSIEEAARVMAAASDAGATVLVWGGGTHQQIGHPVSPDVVVSTERLAAVVAHEPDDLTVVVEAGVRVADLEARLAAHGQTAALPEVAGDATVGGVVAAGVSGYRRARYGPTRDRMIEATIVTGDGRTVRGGGRVVKNVSGYDLPRLAAGSLGSLGVVAVIGFKLWPVPESTVTVAVDDPGGAWRAVHMPVAVLETRAGSWAFLQGTADGVRSQGATLGGEAVDGFVWPALEARAYSCAVRVPPVHVSQAVSRLEPDWEYVAQHGVGVVEVTMDEPDAEALAALRGWAEARGGSLVTAAGEAPAGFDPWGTPPTSLALQRKVVAAFDPAGVCNRGRLPGGI